jgi:hypothetical protein
MFDGKKDINEKGSRKESVFADDFFEVNQLIVPRAIRDEIESQGMDLRWINSSELQKHGGHHKHRWEVYRPKNRKGVVGIQADGRITRGDLVLAVRQKEVTKAYQAKINRASARNKNYDKQAAEELRQDLGGSGVRTKVVTGFDEE